MRTTPTTLIAMPACAPLLNPLSLDDVWRLELVVVDWDPFTLLVVSMVEVEDLKMEVGEVLWVVVVPVAIVPCPGTELDETDGVLESDGTTPLFCVLCVLWINGALGDGDVAFALEVEGSSV